MREGTTLAFVSVKMPGVGRALLNLDLCLAITETENGKAAAISIGGHTLPLGEDFATIEADMMVDEDEADATQP